MTMVLLCQEMRDACWDSSESLGSLQSTVTANKSRSLTVDGLRQCRRGGVVRENKGRSVSDRLKFSKEDPKSELFEGSLRMLLSLIWPV